MESERWRQVDSLLLAALDRPPAERDAFLRESCAGDEELESEVRSLLASQQQAEGFLESPAIEVAAQAFALGQNGEAPESVALRAGQNVLHYRIVEKLGAGGMGVVWKARDLRLDRFVALKFLRATRVSDPERKRRFIQEARAASALNHPNIITIHDIGQTISEACSGDFIAMEYVPGKSLDQLLSGKGLSLKETLPYAIQIADALASAHAAGIVHRDLKPGNIMVNDSGCVKVLDFGLAKLTERSASGEFARAAMAEAPQTDEGTIIGTASYMSPEQAEGKRVDARTDIFSLGAVLYEMVTGRRAFAGDSMLSISTAILRDAPKPAAEIVPGLPPSLDRMIARCLQKDPNRRYQHAGDLKIDFEQVRDELAAGGPIVRETLPVNRGAAGWLWLGVGAACVAVSFAVGWSLHGPPAPPPVWKLTRLTTSAGVSDYPALSPDGKLVAYSADNGLDGSRDLYLKQVAGGQAIRLTSDGTGNTTPDFSPDGSKIVFRSSRNGGGIYEIPALGGEVRRLARDGRNPRFSPDGSQVAFWVGEENLSHAIPGGGTVWVVPLAGGQPQQVGQNFTSARNPIWSPDGKHLLLIGYTSAKAHERSSVDWWWVSTNGGGAVRTGVYEALLRTGLLADYSARDSTQRFAMPKPGCWSAADNLVVSAVRSGGAMNLWQVGLSPETGKVTGVPRRWTTGAGNEVDPSCASGGVLTFTALDIRTNIWSMPFDLNRARAGGPLEPITEGPAERHGPSLSNDGRYAAFSSVQSGARNIWTRELATGKEWIVARSSLGQMYPTMNQSGSRVAFSALEKGKRVVYVSVAGEAPVKVCEDCLRATDWSLDEKALLVFDADPFQIDLLDIASRRQTPLLKHPAYSLLYGRFSPDHRWISFTARIQTNRGRIAIAPADGVQPVPESQWITIAEAGTDDYAHWSPDGKTIYFTSGIDGHNCLWGRRLDANSHRPVGEAFALQHFHGRLSLENDDWSAAGGRIAMVLVEEIGNIWMMSRADPR